uniref:Polygalacturonase n=1 Tax=Aegilops tauschii subsp. strangulata TaxID=200361 RepID=A0A452ZQI5_AEGTS
MVGNCSDVRVRDISCGPGHGISIGSLGKNRTTDRVENVRVDTCLLTNTTNGVRIKSWQVILIDKNSFVTEIVKTLSLQHVQPTCVVLLQGGMGSARDLRFESIVMKNVSNPIIIDQYYCDQPTPCANQTEAVEVRKVEFVDVRGTSATARAIKIACSDTAPCTELELRNVNLTVVGGGAATASCYRASGKAAGVVAPASCLAKGDP